VIAIAFKLDLSTIKVYTRLTLWAKFSKKKVNKQIKKYL